MKNFEKKERWEWKELVGSNISMHTHKTYQAPHMEITGKIVKYISIDKIDYVVIEKKFKRRFFINPLWIISFELIDDKELEERTG